MPIAFLAHRLVLYSASRITKQQARFFNLGEKEAVDGAPAGIETVQNDPVGYGVNSSPVRSEVADSLYQEASVPECVADPRNRQSSNMQDS